MEKIQENLKASLPLLKEASKISGTATLRIAKTLVLFCVFNIVFLTVDLVYLFNGDIVTNKVLLVVTSMIVGVFATIFATIKKYHQVLFEVGKIYFDKLDGFKIKLSENLIEKLEGATQTKVGMTVNQLINIQQLINSSYKNVPKIVAKGLSYLISKAPLIEYVEIINRDFVSQNKEQKVKYLVDKTNDFFDKNIFSINHAKTIRIVFLVTFLVQIGIFYFIKK